MLTVEGISCRLPLTVEERDKVLLCFPTKLVHYNKHSFFHLLAAYAALKIRILSAWSKVSFSI